MHSVVLNTRAWRIPSINEKFFVDDYIACHLLRDGTQHTPSQSQFLEMQAAVSEEESDSDLSQSSGSRLETFSSDIFDAAIESDNDDDSNSYVESREFPFDQHTRFAIFNALVTPASNRTKLFNVLEPITWSMDVVGISKGLRVAFNDDGDNMYILFDHPEWKCAFRYFLSMWTAETLPVFHFPLVVSCCPGNSYNPSILSHRLSGVFPTVPNIAPKWREISYRYYPSRPICTVAELLSASEPGRAECVFKQLVGLRCFAESIENLTKRQKSRIDK